MDPETPATPAADATGVPAVVVPVPASTPAVNPQERLLNELIDERRELRKFVKEFTQSVPATPAAKPAAKSEDKASDPMLEIAQLRQEIAMKDALADAKVTNPVHRELISHAAKSVNPTSLPEFVAKYAASLATSPAAIAPVIPQAPKVGDTGPAASGAGPRIPTDPAAMTQAQIDAMTPAEAQEWWTKHRASQQKFQHPVHRMKSRNNPGSGDLDIANAIAQALSKVRGR